MNKNSSAKKHHIVIIASTIIGISIFLLLCFSFGRNCFISSKLMNSFQSTIEQNTDIEIIDDQSTYGKLNGNGNGINYFGAVLVKSESSKDIEIIISELERQYDIVGYAKQTQADINCYLLEHVSLSFDVSLDDNENYYCIYYFDGSEKSNFFDIRGH